MGRLLVIGDKGLALGDTIFRQKASHEVTKKHVAQIEAKLEKNSFRNPDARQQLALGKLGAYELFAQSRPRLPEEKFRGIRPPEPHRQEVRPAQPEIVKITTTKGKGTKTKKGGEEEEGSQKGKASGGGERGKMRKWGERREGGEECRNNRA